VQAVKLITAITEKGMSPLDKLELIRRFGLLQLCRQCRPASDSRFAVHLAHWVNVLGRCVLEGVSALRGTGNEAAQQAAEEMLDACVLLMLSCLKSLSRDAAVEVIDFATRCVANLKAIGLANARPADKSWLQELLNGVVRMLMYDVEFDFGGDAEEEDDNEELAEWLDKREKISSVFKAIGRLDVQLCVGLVRTMSQSVMPRHTTDASWEKVEVVLYLMMCMGEVLVQEGASAMRDQFRPFLALMLQSDLASNGSFVVVKACFEVILRLARRKFLSFICLLLTLVFS
jgi:hypothetical protein